MLDILLSGCGGRMGRVVAELCDASDDARVVGGIDIAPPSGTAFPVFEDPYLYDGRADVLIDFSHISALPRLLEYCAAKALPLVIATTGHTPEMDAQLAEAAKIIPIFKSANMSVGVSLLLDLVKKAARVLGNGFDIEIIEKHHNQKLDAPSGTAMMIADAASSSLPFETRYVYDRHSVRKKRDKSEIGIHAVRGGTIVGEHDVIFAGTDEVITLSHSAASRNIFASGALKAAGFIASREAPGLYTMNDLVESL